MTLSNPILVKFEYKFNILEELNLHEANEEVFKQHYIRYEIISFYQADKWQKWYRSYEQSSWH